MRHGSPGALLLVKINVNTFPLIFYRYNSTTGTFTVPTGGNGYYYFSIYFALKERSTGLFELHVNGQSICTAIIYTSRTTDFSQSSCGGVVYAEEGKVLLHPLSKFSDFKEVDRQLCLNSGQNRIICGGKNGFLVLW